MALSFPPSPPGGQAVAAQSLYARWQLPSIRESLSSQPMLGPGCPLYVIPLERRALTAPLSSARHSGWRYPVVAGAEAALVTLEDYRPQPLFAAIMLGQPARRFVQAVAFAEVQVRRERRRYEVRILECPALRLSYLWLAGRDVNRFVEMARCPATEPPAGFRMVSGIRGRFRAEVARLK